MHPAPPAGINWDILVHSTQGRILPAVFPGDMGAPQSTSACGSWVLEGWGQKPQTPPVPPQWVLGGGCVSGTGC